MPRGRRKISEDVQQRRKDWAKLFVSITASSRRQIPASDIAGRANDVLSAWPGVDQRLTETQVHFFRKRGSPRVPQTEEVANALVWALENCRAWEGIAEQLARKEKNQLVEGLGFRRLARPAEAPAPEPASRSGLDGFPGGQALRGKEGVLRLLGEVVQIARAAEQNETYVLVIQSSTGFHTAVDREVDELIVRCLQQRANIVYVIGQDWADYPAEDVLESLRLLLKRAITQHVDADAMARTLQDRLFAIRLPPPAVPCWSTRLVRTATVLRIGDASDSRLTAPLLADLAEPIGGWVEILPDFSSRDSNLNIWTVLENARSACALVGKVWSEMVRKKVGINPLFEESANEKQDSL